jgi:hypothetical protein
MEKITENARSDEECGYDIGTRSVRLQRWLNTIGAFICFRSSGC